MPRYKPIVLSAEMSNLGYWVVTISIEPGLRVLITCCRVGISRSEAIADAIATLTSLPATRER